MQKRKLKYIFVLLFPVALVLPLPLKVSSGALILALLNILVLIFSEPKEFTSLKYLIKDRWFLVCLFVFLLDFVTGVLRQSPISYRESRISFLFIPLLFSMIASSLGVIKNDLLKSFVIGVLAYIIFAYGFLGFFYMNLTNRSFELNHFLKYDLVTYLPNAYHHSYIGLYFCFAILIVLYSIGIKALSKPWAIFLVLFIFANQIFMGSKITLIFSLSIIIYFFVIRNTLSWFKAKPNRIITYATIFLFIIVLFLGLERQGLLSTLEHSIGYRWDAWLCSLDLISEKIWLGWGESTGQDQLNLCVTTGMNGTHNQLLEEFLYYGIFGLWVIAFFYVLWQKLGINIFMRIFILVLIMISLFENIFSLQRGILFVLFFSSLFYYTFDEVGET